VRSGPAYDVDQLVGANPSRWAPDARTPIRLDRYLRRCVPADGRASIFRTALRLWPYPTVVDSKRTPPLTDDAIGLHLRAAFVPPVMLGGRFPMSDLRRGAAIPSRLSGRDYRRKFAGGSAAAHPVRNIFTAKLTCRRDG
jgi:hypothetical protein